ncbi:hypothetical protein J2S78_001668 [Salibacterium salarium]|uniref:hypothetical protein n=1 Tax=Salibacterium salarium TaxID=284579 RepID=UPI002787FC83|nr:hypothetical protein [Salibacterium salarium]MDQ0299248.1 hypothetical protein [Salibacterium salarium]
MAFGINKRELENWKQQAQKEEIALITHFWYDPKFPHYHSVTKAANSNVNKLAEWGLQYGLKPEWIHHRDPFPHFDLLGEKQVQVLKEEGKYSQIERFCLNLK